jgi:hypothetical protein
LLKLEIEPAAVVCITVCSRSRCTSLNPIEIEIQKKGIFAAETLLRNLAADVERCWRRATGAPFAPIPVIRHVRVWRPVATLWLFREKLVKAGLIDKLFERFGQHLEAKATSRAAGR